MLLSVEGGVTLCDGKSVERGGATVCGGRGAVTVSNYLVIVGGALETSVPTVLFLVFFLLLIEVLGLVYCNCQSQLQLLTKPVPWGLICCCRYLL